MLPCILESFNLVQQVILCALNPFSLFFVEKFCSYKGITKSWQHKAVNKLKLWGKKVKAIDATE